MFCFSSKDLHLPISKKEKERALPDTQYIEIIGLTTVIRRERKRGSAADDILIIGCAYHMD